MYVKFIVVFCLLTTFNIGNAQGIEFFEGTWEEALEKADQEDKMIFVDAYAVWCGPCKRMAKNVFPDESVGAFHNKHFINMKIDAEKPMGRTFQAKYPVSAFPTLFYIDPEGKEVQKAVGYRDVKGLLDIGELAIRNYAGNSKFVRLFEEGDRSPEVVFNYITYKNKIGEPDVKAANEYIRSQENLDTESNLKVLYAACIQCDSKIYELFVARKKAMINIFGEEEVEKKIVDAMNATIKRAVLFESDDLLEEAKEKAKQAKISNLSTFLKECDYNYYRDRQMISSYRKAAKDLAKKDYKKQANKLNMICSDILNTFPEDRDLLIFAAEIGEKSIKIEPSVDAYYLTGQALYNVGKVEKAKSILEKGFQFAEKNGTQIHANFIPLLDRIKREL